MAIKWGFGRKDQSNETPPPAESAPESMAPAEPAPAPGFEPPKEEREPTGAVFVRKGALLMGRGFAAPIWERILSAAGVDVVSDRSLRKEDFGEFVFEVIIETEKLFSENSRWRGEDSEPGEHPKLAKGGVVLLPCYGASPTTMASLIGGMGASAVGYTLFDAPPDEAAQGLVIEIARPMQAREEAWKQAIKWLRIAGLRPETAGDAPGLVFGRTIACLINEAAWALTEEVASSEDIDSAMRLGVNYPKGPLAWADELGLDLILEILEGLADHYEEDRYRPAPLLRHMLLAGGRFFPGPEANGKVGA